MAHKRAIIFPSGGCHSGKGTRAESLCIEDAEPSGGESLVLITDGVIEARGHGDRFGSARLEDLLHGLSCTDSAEKVVDAVVEELRAYSVSELDDDVAVVAIRFAPEA